MEQLNNEFQKIKTAMDRLVSRYADAPNAMQFPLDLGGQDIINVGKITAVDLEVGGIDLASQVQAAQDSADAAAGHASDAQAAVSSAQGYANTAAGFADDAEAAYNNIRFANVVTVTSSFTLSTVDTTKVVFADSTSVITITLDDGADVGTQAVVVQQGTGVVTFAVEGTDTLLSFDSLTDTAGPGAAVTAIKISGGWYIGGNLA